MNTIEMIVDEILSLYDRYGDAEYIGEPVSQVSHMLQAARLALEEGYDDNVVVAAFLHDIGHICVQKDHSNDMNGLGVIAHEKIGADFLRQNPFPEDIIKLVENHVKAKRYLTWKYPSYYSELSEASKQTLEYQGGRMTFDEAEEFEKDPLFSESIALRRWDDQAKETGTELLTIGFIREKMLAVCKGQRI